MQEGGIRYFDLMVLRAGVEYQARVLVRNNLTGDLGTATARVTTRKDAGSFTMATPLFVLSKSGRVKVVGYDPQKPPERL